MVSASKNRFLGENRLGVTANLNLPTRVPGPFPIRKVNVRDVNGNVSSKVSGVVKTVFSPTNKKKLRNRLSSLGET